VKVRREISVGYSEKINLANFWCYGIKRFRNILKFPSTIRGLVCVGRK